MDTKKDEVKKENVISIFAAQRDAAKEISLDDANDSDFEEIVKKNKLAQEKMKKERTKGNQSVLRSYRLKT